MTLDERAARLEEPHIAPLTEFVKRICRETGARVPWFDPADAGVEARVLFLFQDPGRSGAAVSGYVSVDNDDPSARAIAQLRADAGLQRDEVIHWNAIPRELERNPKVRRLGVSRRSRSRQHTRLLRSQPDHHRDRTLEQLYGEDRRGGLGASAPRVARWLGDIRTYFPSSVVRVMQQDAMDRLG